MGIVFTDGFDSYAATVDLLKKWGVTGSPWAWSATAGRTGGGAIQSIGGSGVTQSRNGVLSTNLVCFGFWLVLSTTPASQLDLLYMQNAAGTVTGKIRVNTNGTLSYTSSSNTVVANTSRNICDNLPHWCEFQMGTANTTTSKAVIDGTQEYSTASVINVGVNDHFGFTGITGVTTTVSMLVVFDDSSGAPQTAQFPLGPRQISTIRPQADGVVGFTTATGGGTHWDQVSEVNADGDATYVESANSGDQDLYDFAALGISPATITAVVANAYATNPNAGVINLVQIAKSGATQTNGASVQAPSSYQTKQQSFPLDPSTAAAWASASAVDAANFGVKVG